MAELMHPWIDVSRAPLYVVRFPARATNEEVEEYCKSLLQWYKTLDHPVAWIVDCSAVEASAAPQRRIFAEYEKRYEPYAGKLHRGTAFVVPGGFVRGLVTAIYWLSPPSYPYAMFARLAPAESWATARLRED